jgi:hypothetical protein
MASLVQCLEHAGFIVQHQGVKILIDPWFPSAFLHSWFPYPDNRYLISELRSMDFNYLYISHAHEDHYDERLRSTARCYDYPREAMQKRADSVRHDLMDTLIRKVLITNAKAYIPSAVPPCFLDPALERHNDRQKTIFPHWEDWQAASQRRVPTQESCESTPATPFGSRGRDPWLMPYSGGSR